jgi:hypothetical protein
VLCRSSRKESSRMVTMAGVLAAHSRVRQDDVVARVTAQRHALFAQLNLLLYLSVARDDELGQTAISKNKGEHEAPLLFHNHVDWITASP